MDLSLTRESVRVCEPVFEGSAEHPVDCEIILPDYCPDIARVLRTQAAVNIASKSLETNRLIVNGNFCITVVYLPEESGYIRCVTHNVPFSHSFDLREANENCYSKVKARMVFANCRPTGPRRIQIKASAAISAKIWTVHEESFVSDCEDDRIELLKKPIKVSSIVGSTEKDFKVNEDFEIANSKPPVASVIKTSATAVVQDYKVVGNKIIAKGEVMVRMLYSCEDGSLEKVEYSIPISQIIDLDGVNEDCSCEVHFIAGDARVETEAGADGENRILSFEIDITTQAKANREIEVYAVADAFCPQYEMNLKFKPVSLENLADMMKANEMLRLTMENAGDDIASVSDCSASPVVSSVKFDGKALVLEGNMEVSILALDSGGSPLSIERGIPFSIREELANHSEIMRCEPEITVLSAECSAMGEGRLDIRVECVLEAQIYGVMQGNVIVDMQVDEEKEKSCPNRKTLTLYFADKDERLWDIAKRYNTSMNSIMSENSLEGDKLEERRMLLIPKARCKKINN